MNASPLHPMLVHLPVALAVLLPLASVGLLLAWWRGTLPRRTWLIVVVLQALLVGGGIVAMRTGEADEERVEGVVGEAAIEAHEEAAEAFVWGGGAVLALAIAASLLRNDRRARIAAAATALGTLVVLGLGYRVGEAGGALVYRHGAASAYTAGARAQPAAERAVAAQPGARLYAHDDDD